MKKINENEMARTVTLDEGQYESISVAQVKEVIRLVRDYLATKSASEVMEWVERSQ